MNTRPFNKIARSMAEAILRHGNDERGTCHRIQFKVGGYGNEVSGGGLGLPGLANHLEALLDENMAEIASIIKERGGEVLSDIAPNEYIPVTPVPGEPVPPGTEWSVKIGHRWWPLTTTHFVKADTWGWRFRRPR